MKENAHVRVVNKQRQDDNESEDPEMNKQKPVTKSGLVFDRTSFTAEGSTADLTVNDPHFWEKVLSQGQISIEMLSLKLEDGSALSSRQTKLKFMTNLELAMERIVAEMAGQTSQVQTDTKNDAWNSISKRNIGHEYDVAVNVLQKILKCKSEFSVEQRKV